MFRRHHALGLVMLAASLLAPALAQAHGASGDELGPPLLTSGLLGFVSYWVVMLWPSSPRNQTPRSGSDRQDEQGPQIRTPRKAGRAKRMALSHRVRPARVVRRQEESGNG
jgi:hypothetical protein